MNVTLKLFSCFVHLLAQNPGDLAKPMTAADSKKNENGSIFDEVVMLCCEVTNLVAY